MSQDFRKLRAWQLADDLVLEIYRVTERFPPEEQYGLTSQLRRASVSAAANIAEGPAVDSRKEFCRFLQIARGSMAEVGYYLHLSHRLKYLTEMSYGDISKKYDAAARTLAAFLSAVRRSD